MKAKKFVQWKTGFGEIMLGRSDGENTTRLDGCPCVPPAGAMQDASEKLLDEFIYRGKWLFTDPDYSTKK